MPYSTSPAGAMILREGRKAFTSPTTLTLGIVLVLACAICIGCDGRGKGEVEFETAIVSRGDIERRVIATGRIEPFSKVEIRSKVGGIIKVITVDEGDRVRQGQTILELDKDILISKVNEARAALASAERMQMLGQHRAA